LWKQSRLTHALCDSAGSYYEVYLHQIQFFILRENYRLPALLAREAN